MNQTKTMEAQLHQPESLDTTTSDTYISAPESLDTSTSDTYIPAPENSVEVIDTTPVAMLPPASEPSGYDQWQRFSNNIKTFFAELPENVSHFFSDYRKPLTTLGLIVAAIVTVRILIAILDALNGIPLLQSSFELIGIGYSVWFVNRYLLKAEDRQELYRQYEQIKQQIIGYRNSQSMDV
jgi:CAAD domains of cyanobacterial aminoacyl-tRNA synthetase